MNLHGFRKYRSYEGNQIAYFKPRISSNPKDEGRYWVIMGDEMNKSKNLQNLFRYPATYTCLTPGNIGFYEIPNFFEKIKHIIKIIRM